MTPTSLALSSASRSEDAGFLATHDIAGIAAELDVEYRLIGGISVGLLTWVHGVAGRVPARETADADFGGAPEVIADPRLPAALEARGYRRAGGNRFTRRIPCDGTELDLAVDLLAPSWKGRLVSNVRMGDLFVDEVPGLALALAMPPTAVQLRVQLSDGQELVTPVALPDVVAALCLKAESYRGRRLQRDAIDVWRLLEAADEAGVRPGLWGSTGQKGDAARILREEFGMPGGRGSILATEDRGVQARIQALALRVLGGP